jgi:hypothetical protein
LPRKSSRASAYAASVASVTAMTEVASATSTEFSRARVNSDELKIAR